MFSIKKKFIKRKQVIVQTEYDQYEHIVINTLDKNLLLRTQEGGDQVIFKLTADGFQITLQDNENGKQQLQVTQNLIASINQLVNSQILQQIIALPNLVTFGGNTQDMISDSYYIQPPAKGSFFITNTNQLFVLSNSDYQQLSNWIYLNNFYDANNQQIKNLAPATDQGDALSLQQIKGIHFLYAFITSNIETGITETYNIQFNDFISSNISEDSKNIKVINNSIFIKAGIYKFEITAVVKYKASTNYPIKYKIVGDIQGIFQGTLTETDTTQSFQSNKTTSTNHILQVSSDQFVYLQFQTSPQYIDKIVQGTQLIIQQLQ